MALKLHDNELGAGARVFTTWDATKTWALANHPDSTACQALIDEQEADNDNIRERVIQWEVDGVRQSVFVYPIQENNK